MKPSPVGERYGFVRFHAMTLKGVPLRVTVSAAAHSELQNWTVVVGSGTVLAKIGAGFVPRRWLGSGSV